MELSWRSGFLCTRQRIRATMHAAEPTVAAFFPIASPIAYESHAPSQSVPCLSGEDLTANSGNPSHLNLPRSPNDLESPVEVASSAQKQIEREVGEVIALARAHFSMIGEPDFELVQDSDHDEHYLGIHVYVSGEPEIVVRQGRSFFCAVETRLIVRSLAS